MSNQPLCPDKSSGLVLTSQKPPQGSLTPTQGVSGQARALFSLLFLLGQFCLSKKLFPPHIQLPACLSVCPTFIHPLAYPSSNQSSISLPPDSSVHTYIHMSTQSSTSLPKYPPIYSIHISICLPKHPPICLPIYLTIHPSIPLPTDTYPPIHLSTYPPSLPSHPPSISLPTHPLIYLYPYIHPPILSH